MTEQKLGDVVKNVLQIEISDVDENMKFKDMEIWDSMTFMMLIVRTEEAFNITLTDDEIIELDCIKKAKEIISRKLMK
ncbi:MAG: acyl carrier protein [Bacteroidales bacterium]|jgi:acyl carrier protein|nr:acyl carrier protein [Bacteroidales bacterium]